MTGLPAVHPNPFQPHRCREPRRMLTLSQIAPGQTARIQDIVGEDGIAIRLMEMGLTDGESITYIGAAPLGDPLEFSVRGYRLSLRRTEADRIHVDLIETV